MAGLQHLESLVRLVDGGILRARVSIEYRDAGITQSVLSESLLPANTIVRGHDHETSDRVCDEQYAFICMIDPRIVECFLPPLNDLGKCLSALWRENKATVIVPEYHITSRLGPDGLLAHTGNITKITFFQT